MKTTMLVLVLLCLVATVVSAESVLDAVAENLQLQGLYGTQGVAAAAYWPVAYNSTYQIDGGPLLGLGESTAILGAAVKVPVEIPFPLLDRVRFLWGGLVYNWEQDEAKGAAGVGAELLQPPGDEEPLSFWAGYSEEECGSFVQVEKTWTF